jgi:UrcA family protein
MRTSFPVVIAMGSLVALGSLAQAAEPTPEVTITGTQVEKIPYDVSVRRPAEDVTVTASVPVNPGSLTLNSGVALLQDNVRDAALRACMKADPAATATSDGTLSCVNRAVRLAQPQIEALVARARSVAKS